jgi:hypothetical protein
MADRITESSSDNGLARKMTRRQLIKEAAIGAAVLGSILSVPAGKKLTETITKKESDIPFVPLEELMTHPEKYTSSESDIRSIKTEGYLQYSYTIKGKHPNVVVGMFHIKPILDFVPSKARSDNPSFSDLVEPENARYFEVEYLPFGKNDPITDKEMGNIPEMSALEGKIALEGRLFEYFGPNKSLLSKSEQFFIVTEKIEVLEPHNK